MRSSHWLLGLGFGACSLACTADRTRFVLLETESEAAETAETAEATAAEENDGVEENDGTTAGAGPAEPAPPRSDFVDVAGSEFTPGEPPVSSAAGALPKIVELTGPVGVTNGGRAVLHATLEPQVANPLFVVSLDGDTGYHLVQGTDADGDGRQEIEVEVHAEVQVSPLVIAVAPTDGNGSVGEYAQVSLELVPSGVGDVKITLSFSPTHDLDLHVFEPGGTELSYLHPKSAAGGQLDLDSGANCGPSVASAENIFWPPGAAPPGEYQVRVHDFEECERGAIDFTLRVENGPLVETYRNAFAAGAEGTWIDVVTFTH